MAYKHTTVRRAHTKNKAPQQWCIPAEWGSKTRIAPSPSASDANSPELLKAQAKRARKAKRLAKETIDGTK